MPVSIRSFCAGVAIAVLFGACGGNYSNEDIDFQLALPKKTDLAVTLPVMIDDPATSAEYLRLTRGMVFLFGAITDAFLGLVDHVRLYPATTRAPGKRVWGPFPDENNPGWWVRITMERMDDPAAAARFRFDYRLEFTQSPRIETSWIRFLWGHFEPAGGVSRGVGQLRIDTQAARDAGFPVDRPHDKDDLNDLLRLTIDYNRLSFPITIKMDIENLPTNETPQVHYESAQNADGSGSMLFSQAITTGGIWVQALEVRSFWLGSGEGRGDASVTAGIATGSAGTDCWDGAGRPVYIRRDWAPEMNQGTESACVAPPLLP